MTDNRLIDLMLKAVERSVVKCTNLEELVTDQVKKLMVLLKWKDCLLNKMKSRSSQGKTWSDLLFNGSFEVVCV